MEEWKEYKLGQVVTPVKDKIDTSALSVATYISTENMLPNKSGITVSSNIPPGNAIHFQVGDILISNIRPYFKKIWMANKSGGCSADVVCLRATNIIDPHYLYFLLSQNLFFDYVMLGAKGTKMPRGDRNQMMQWPVLLPPIQYQHKIASVLSSIDAKIDLNKRINDNLEQQAKALFKSWFVDFEPFRDGEFVDSELGRIPQNWIVGTLRDLCVANKRTYNGKFVHEIQYIDTGSVTNNIIESIQTLNPVTDIIPSRARRAVTEGDIIYSSVRPNQKHYAFLYNPLPNTVVSTGFVVLTANWSGYRYYIYQYLIQDEIIDKLQSIAEQSVSTYPTLNASDLTNLKIVIPPNNVIGDFASLCHSYIAQIYKQQEESRRLAQLRDSLLPRLMSGELKVNEVTI